MLRPCSSARPMPTCDDARIAEQEIGERVSRPLAVEREIASRVGRVDRIELQAEEIPAELQTVIAALDHHVVVQLVAAIFARDERGRVADRAEESAERDLRIAHVARIAGHSLQAGRAGESDALIRAHLPAARAEVAEPHFVQPARPERVGVTDGDVLAPGRDRSPETRDQRLVQRRRAERLCVVHAVGRHTGRTG